MAYEKIVTCCYCGTRAALVLMGDQKHCLACSFCGAPITQMKHLKKPASNVAHAGPSRASYPAQIQSKPPKPKKKKQKAKKTHKMFKEVFDLIEDIFD